MARIVREDRNAAGLCVQYGCPNPNRSGRVYCTSCAALVNERRKKYTLSYKLRVLDAYGGRVCIGCGETEIVVLSLDHINGNGSEERRILRIGSGTPFYQWLIRNKFPAGYRVLCMNCQFRARQNVPFPIKTQEI